MRLSLLNGRTGQPVKRGIKNGVRPQYRQLLVHQLVIR